MRSDPVPTDINGKMWRFAEEAGEVVKAISKFQRFGATPTDEKTGITYDNVRDMLAELNDLEHAMTDLRAAMNGSFVPVPFWEVRHLSGEVLKTFSDDVAAAKYFDSITEVDGQVYLVQAAIVQTKGTID